MIDSLIFSNCFLKRIDLEIAAAARYCSSPFLAHAHRATAPSKPNSNLGSAMACFPLAEAQNVQARAGVFAISLSRRRRRRISMAAAGPCLHTPHLLRQPCYATV
jgi:hypothetical protein